MPAEGPVRLCCGQRHAGARCPDGLVMCCMCFGRFPDDQLQRDADDPSKRWDVCLPCAARDAAALADKEQRAASGSIGPDASGA